MTCHETLQLILDIHALALEGGLLCHARQDVNDQIGGGDRRGLGYRVVRGADLDDIRTDEVEALEALEQALQLAGSPAARLGGASGGGNAGVEDVNVNGEVCGRVADGIFDLLDNAGDANVVDLVGLDQGEANDLGVDDVVIRALCC